MTVYIVIDWSQAQHDVCFPDDRASTLVVVNHAEARVLRLLREQRGRVAGVDYA